MKFRILVMFGCVATCAIVVAACDGSTGPTGAMGAMGNMGAPGATGAPGVGSTGAAGAPGSPGATGVPGATGSPGAAGATGSPGATGATGAPGTVATPVAAQAGIYGFGAIEGLTVDPNGNLWVAYNPSYNFEEDERVRQPFVNGRTRDLESNSALDVAEYAAGTVTAAAGFATPAPTYDAALTTTNQYSLVGFAVDAAQDVFVSQDDQIEAFAAPASSSETPASVTNDYTGSYAYDGQKLAFSNGTLYALDAPTAAPSGTPAPAAVIQPYTFASGTLTPGTPIIPAALATPASLVGDYTGTVTSVSVAGYDTTPTVSVFLNIATGIPASSNLFADTTGGYDSVARDPSTGDVYYNANYQTPTVLVYAPGGTNAIGAVAYFVLPSTAVTMTVDKSFLYVALLNGTIEAYPKYSAASPDDARSGHAFDPYRPFSKAAYARLHAR